MGHDFKSSLHIYRYHKKVIMPTVSIGFTVDSGQWYWWIKDVWLCLNFVKIYPSDFFIYNLDQALNAKTYVRSHISPLIYDTWIITPSLIRSFNIPIILAICISYIKISFISMCNNAIRTWYVHSKVKWYVFHLASSFLILNYYVFPWPFVDICFPCMQFTIILIPLAHIFYNFWHNL